MGLREAKPEANRSQPTKGEPRIDTDERQDKSVRLAPSGLKGGRQTDDLVSRK